MVTTEKTPFAGKVSWTGYKCHGISATSVQNIHAWDNAKTMKVFPLKCFAIYGISSQKFS